MTTVREVEMTDENLLLAFVIKWQGDWSDDKVPQRRRWLEKNGISLTDDELGAALARARERFFERPAEVFVCRSGPCRERAPITPPEDICGYTRTECQGPCKHAPVATVRVGDRCEVFAEMRSREDWRAVLDFGRRAVAAGTLLVDPAAAQAFRYDPVHDGERISAALRPAEFLVGVFRGNGEYADRAATFQKEVLSGWEAGGRFISMRMSATYPLDDGRRDVHHVLVVLGADSVSDALSARAYTDGGLVFEYHVEPEGDALIFADRVPGHAEGCSVERSATRA
ncbi:MAG: (2Fe-2S) ferredoxin domain-containing protein [Gammaproteobacteria bacterium]